MRDEHVNRISDRICLQLITLKNNNMLYFILSSWQRKEHSWLTNVREVETEMQALSRIAGSQSVHRDTSQRKHANLSCKDTNAKNGNLSLSHNKRCSTKTFLFMSQQQCKPVRVLLCATLYRHWRLLKGTQPFITIDIKIFIARRLT